MSRPIRFASSLLAAMTLAAPAARAGDVTLSDVSITARATFSSQRVTPEISDFDSKTAPPDQLLQAAQALVREGLPFPNQPNSQNSGFASSAGVVGGVFGVGVNGFHFENSLPPNRYFASGTWSQTLTNDSSTAMTSSGAIFVPAPTLRFFGVGNSFPPGANPDLDATASVDIRLTATLTHADGSTVDNVIFDYGMRTLRAPIVGVLLVDPTDDALGALSRFDEPDGSFGFRLLPVSKSFSFGTIGPGESMKFGYDYFASASTGFGETAVFAAIGDPFDLSTGGRFEVQFLPVSDVPEPHNLALTAVGLALLAMRRRRRRVATEGPSSLVPR
jgi:MYXO-CTERM domain-containing protein